MNVIVDTFTVSNPTDFHAAPIDNFTFDILHGLQEQINADLYVSPSGNNNNTGLTIDDPLKTIQYACSVILADSQNLHIIHLAEGTYSPSANSEFFPVDIPDFVSLCGVSETGVILNAEGMSGVVRLNNAENVTISNLTITNGNAKHGGGIYCESSSPSLENVTITGNSAWIGGGIYCSVSSSPNLVNCIFWNNSPQEVGFFDYDDPNTITIAYSDIDGGEEGIETSNNGTVSWLEGNIDADPLFVDAEMGDYHLTEYSPCIDAGIAYFEYEGEVLVDLGEDDYYGNAPDMGAYEYDGVVSLTAEFVASDTISCVSLEVQFTDFSFGDPINWQWDFENDGEIDSYEQDPVWVYEEPGVYSVSLTASDVVARDTSTELKVDYITVLETFPVHNLTQDIWYYTIQAGINASENGDEIIVSPGTYVENIDFDGKAITLGSLFYTTQDTSYISQTIIDGNQNGSVVIFISGEDSTSILTGFTITNGYVNNGNWPNIYGGGLTFHNYSSPTISYLKISNNYSLYGGGFFCSNSNPTLTNVDVFNNIADGSGGGAVLLYSNSLIENCNFNNNQAFQYNGGAIYCYGGSPTIRESKLMGNSSIFGGGMLLWTSNATLENLQIKNNTANGGGGLHIYDGSSPLIINSIISDNYTLYNGGGIQCEDAANPTLVNTTIRNNESILYGAGIYCTSNSSLTFSATDRCNIYSNTLENVRGFGSDIFTKGCDPINVIVDTFTVLTPTDYYASPISNFTFDILHSISANLINSDIYVAVDGNDSNIGTSSDDPLKTINHALSVIYSDSLNINTIFLASGIYSNSTNGETFPICWNNYVNLQGSDENDTIIDAEYSFTVLEFFELDEVNVEAITIKNGSCYYGGGIYCLASSPSLKDVTIMDNNATYGGGIYYRDCTSASLANVTLIGNTASNGGGIYYNDCTSASLANVTLTGNTASNVGGGIYCYASFIVLANVTLTGNTASIYGGGIYCNASSIVLDNITLTGNTASINGGGICCRDGAYPILINSILWNNFPQEVYFREDDDPLTITVSYSDIEGGVDAIVTNNNGTVNWLEGNIDEDPLFVDAENGDYHLTENSPCIDAGTAYFVYEGEVLVDLSEDEYFGISPDMGAYEYEENAVIYYGDIDDNGLVESFDASLVLMYVVGLDPLPADPLPWSDWRVERADVDISGDIGAVDATYILQYVVEIISELPVVNAMRLSAGEITISNDAEYIYLRSLNAIFSFEYELTKSENLTIDLPEVINDNCLYSCNDNKFALISAAGIAGNIVRIPYYTESQGAWNVHFQIEDNGNSYDLEYLPEDIPEFDRLISIYPNPFNPETNILFELSAGSNVLIEIYNIKGQKVTTLINGPFEAGSHKVTWNATDHSSGIYLLRFHTAERSETKKLILLK